ncbi:MAG: Rrf2 family transcriptional regulator [bacterium]|nr:Rrf2 family transcriptional regulator [bacterium]
MPRALKISEAASLALHAMGLIAALPGGKASARVIASRLGVSEAHLSKVLQRLAKAGFLRSVRGPKGGFSLPRSAEEITLLEVYEAIEGPIEAHHCLFDRPLCEGAECGLGTVIGNANEQLRLQLAETRLSDVGQLFRPGREPGSG